MSESRNSNAKALAEANRRLRAQVAQLEDRLDHLSEHGPVAKALREAESLHRDVMSIVSDVVLIADDTGQLIYVSPNAQYIFARDAADILKVGKVSSAIPDQVFEADTLQIRGEIDNFECQIRDALGRTRDLLITVRRINGEHGATVFAVRDATEQQKLRIDNEFLRYTFERRVEEQTRELRESRERFRRMVEGLRDEYLFYSTDADGTVTYVSPSVYSILGYSPQSIIGKNWRLYINTSHELYPQLERLDTLKMTGVTTPSFRAPVLHSSGETLIMEFRDASVRDAEGRIVGSEGIGKDITKQLERDEAIRRAQDEMQNEVFKHTRELKAINGQLWETTQRYQSVVDDQLEFIVRWQGEGELKFQNEAYRRHCRATRPDSENDRFLNSIIEQDRKVLERKLKKLTPDYPVVTHEHRVALADGRVILEFWTHRALFDPAGKLIEYQSVGSDVTNDRRREQLAQELNVALEAYRTLSDRERDVMDLVVLGDANKVIARKLTLSVKTIEKHRSSIMRKLKVRSVPELVRVAILVEESGDI